MRIDHVAIAGRDLGVLETAYSAAGFPVERGGLHAGGATEMAIIRLGDGSYVELIAPADEGLLAANPFWTEHLLGDAGPCGWAVRVEDIEREVRRLIALGVEVHGPFEAGRERPDGQQSRWRMVFVGEHGPGATLPFLIQDITPRELRVPMLPSGSRPLAGVDAVVLGVENLEETVALFRAVYRLPRPARFQDDEFGARLAFFPGTPIILAAPSSASSWLHARVQAFGPSPCAYLLDASDGGFRLEQYAGFAVEAWCERALFWLEADAVAGARLALCVGGL